MLSRKLLECQHRARQFDGGLLPKDCLDMMSMVYGSDDLRSLNKAKLCVKVQMLLRAGNSATDIKAVKSAVTEWRKS